MHNTVESLNSRNQPLGNGWIWSLYLASKLLYQDEPSQ
jgi:hypothetical protein